MISGIPGHLPTCPCMTCVASRKVDARLVELKAIAGSIPRTSSSEKREKLIYNSGYWSGAAMAPMIGGITEHAAHGWTPMAGAYFFMWVGFEAWSIRCMEKGRAK